MWPNIFHSLDLFSIIPDVDDRWLSSNHWRSNQNFIDQFANVMVLNDGTLGHVNDHADEEGENETFNSKGKNMFDARAKTAKEWIYISW